MATQTATTKSKFFRVLNADGREVVCETAVGQITTSPAFIATYEDDIEMMSKVVAGDEESFLPLPKKGELVRLGIYSDEGILVKCLQEHNRTEHPVADIPALFLIYRANPDGAEWIANEFVEADQTRTYEGDTYKVLQPHSTQDGWEPPNVPALWELVVIVEDNIFAAGIDVEVGDEYWYPDADGDLYRVVQAHTTAAHWPPPAVPALWELVV